MTEQRKRYSTFDTSKPRKPLKQISDRRAAKMDSYEDACEVVHERDRGRCQAAAKVNWVMCAGPKDPHHLIYKSRAPHLWDDPNNIITLCRMHHDWVHVDWVQDKRRPEDVTPETLGLVGHSWDVERDD